MWHNARLPEDVDDSGAVIPLDALLVINDLNVNGGRRLPSPGVGPQAPPPYLDVNDDGWLSPIDALIVINKLNAAGAGAASGGAGPSGGAANGEAPDVVPFTTLSANSAPQTPMDIRQLLASTYRSTLAVSTADGEAKSALRNAHKSTAKSGIRAFLADSGVTDAWLDQVASDVGQIWHGDDDQCDGHSHWDVD